MNRVCSFLVKFLPKSRRVKIHAKEVSKYATLMGTGHHFDESGSISLRWGSIKEDVIMEDHSELFGSILSYNHGKVILGKWAKVGLGCKINCVNSIEIGDDVAIADFVTIVDHNFHPINPNDRRYMRHTPHGAKERQPMFSANAPIRIGNNVWIGEHVRICKGVTIGDNSIVGACSIVTKNIPSNCIAVGNPARVVKENIDTETIPIFPLKD